MALEERVESIKLKSLCPRCLGRIPLAADNNAHPDPDQASLSSVCHCKSPTELSAPEPSDQSEEEHNGTHDDLTPKDHISEAAHEATEVVKTVSVREQENIFGDRFKVLGEIGKGGAATVYKVLDTENQIVLAAKVMHKKLLQDPRSIQRFFQEASSIRQLSHPNLVSLLEHGLTTSGAPYLIMEYIDGPSLADVLSERHTLPVHEALQILKQIAAALEHAHAKGIIHRDIKPSNILLSRNEEGNWNTKLVDFGIAKSLSAQSQGGSKLTQTGDIFGSPAYMSPEQCLGLEVDVRSDIYSLGCVMHEVLTGRNPFFSPSPVKAIMNHLEFEPEPFELEFKHLRIPKQVETLVLSCIRRKPEQRPQSVRALAKRLDKLSTSERLGTGRIAIQLIIDLYIIAVLAAACGTRIEPAVITIAYFSLFESTFQATPGMFMTGMKIVGPGRGRPHFLGAVAFYSTLIATVATFLSAVKMGVCLDALWHCQWCARIALLSPFIPMIINSIFAHSSSRLSATKRTGRGGTGEQEYGKLISMQQLEQATGHFLVLDSNNCQLLRLRIGQFIRKIRKDSIALTSSTSTSHCSSPQSNVISTTLRRRFVWLTVGAALGYSLSVTLSSMLEQWTLKQPSADTTNTVYVTRPLQSGYKITRRDLAVRKELKNRIFWSDPDYHSINRAIGKTLYRPVADGETLTDYYFMRSRDE